MKKVVLMLMLVVSSLILSACGGIDPTAIVAANTQVQSFLEEYPNAEMTVAMITASNVAAENEFVNEICGINLEEATHYKITINDPDSKLNVYAYVSKAEQDIVCLKKTAVVNEKETIVDDMTEKETEVVKKEESTTKEEVKDQEQAKEEYKEKEELKEVVDEDCNVEIDLMYTVIDNKVVLEWTPYTCSNLKGYKVVRSDSVENPTYPKDGYIAYVTDKGVSTFEDKLQDGVNYYAITVRTHDGDYYSNSVTVEGAAKDETSKEEEKEEVVESEPVDFESVLEYEIVNGSVVLDWNAYEGEDLEYYKVVWSQENEDLMYPEDGYISYQSTTGLVVPAEKFKEGTNYYRISTILSGFYGDSSKRINSNVVVIEK